MWPCDADTVYVVGVGITYDEAEQADVAYVYGESTSGQRAGYELRMSGLPVVNVNDNCSTGSTALYFVERHDLAGRRDLDRVECL